MSEKIDALNRLLLELEAKLMDPEVRKDRDQVAALLHADFREFGSSGREWSKETVLDLLQAEALYTRPAVADFTVKRLTPGSALVTYRTVGNAGATLRSSLWVQDDGAWRILFHQGTKIPQA
jgi:hypothetical protein